MQASQIHVGRRIRYTGDMANLPGEGVIVAVHGEPGQRPAQFLGRGVGLVVQTGDCRFDAILFDGRRWDGIHEHSVEGAGHRFELMERVHGPAMIEAAKRIAAQTEADRAIREAREKLDHEAAIERLKAEHPHLTPSAKYAGGAVVAKNLRAALKHAGIKAKSVRSDHNSIRVVLAHDVPAGQFEAAKAIGDRFEYGHFDGMTDCYEFVTNAWADAFGGVRFVFVERDWQPTQETQH